MLKWRERYYEVILSYKVFALKSKNCFSSFYFMGRQNLILLLMKSSAHQEQWPGLWSSSNEKRIVHCRCEPFSFLVSDLNSLSEFTFCIQIYYFLKCMQRVNFLIMIFPIIPLQASLVVLTSRALVKLFRILVIFSYVKDYFMVIMDNTYLVGNYWQQRSHYRQDLSVGYVKFGFESF